MRIDLGCKIVDSAFADICAGYLLHVQQCRRCDRVGANHQDPFWSLVEAQNAAGALTDDLEVIAVVPSIEGQVEAPGAGIAKQIWILIPLVGHGGHERLLLGQVDSVFRRSQDYVAARSVVIAGDREIEPLGMPGGRFS